MQLLIKTLFIYDINNICEFHLEAIEEEIKIKKITPSVLKCKTFLWTFEELLFQSGLLLKKYPR